MGRLAEISKGDFLFSGFKDVVTTLWFLKHPCAHMRQHCTMVMFMSSGARELSSGSSLAPYHAPA